MPGRKPKERENKEKGTKKMKKMNNKRGFTLAELLIVVAIIAVLVAISIPVFTSQLAKAQASTDAANVRAAYAEILATNLSDPNATLSSATYEFTAKGNSADLPSDITWPDNLTNSGWTKGQTIGFTITQDPTTKLVTNIKVQGS